MRSTAILTPLLLTVLLASLVSRASAAGSYERAVELDGRLILKSDELMRLVELARVNLPNEDLRTESLRLNDDDSKLTIGEGFAIEDITRVGASHGSGSYKLIGSSISIELIWHEYQTRLSVGAKDRDQMEMVSAVLEQKIRAALERSLREQLTVSVPAQPSVHRREFELPPLAFTYNDVLRLVEQIESLLPPARLGDTALTIGSGDEKVKIPGPLTANALARLPRRSISLDYYFQALNMPISRVTISLRDYDRRVEVEGTDEGQVNALASMLRSELEKHTALIGGPGRRFALAAVVFFLGLGLARLVARDPKIKTLWKRWTYAVVIAGIVLFFLGFFGGEWLPGTEIDANDASFLNRNSGLWSLLGFVLAVPAPPFFVLLRSWVSAKVSPSTQPAAAAEPVSAVVKPADATPDPP